MQIPSVSVPLFFIFVVTIFKSISALSHSHSDFLQCLSLHSKNQTGISRVVYSPENSSYSSILQFSIRNLRFTLTSTPKPLIIITPQQESQIQATILCARENELQIRTRSGGHDYEGLSYTSQVPFVVIDLAKMSEIKINVARKRAWVQAGATVGQLYYKISQRSRTLAFPAGTCPTVGVGGHFSGGGYGTLLRKYGLAADNIVDARLIDVSGKILDRKSMGEELFWAIRGGGGASFGVITAWKLKLVHVPETVTVFSVKRTLEQNATGLVYKWQYVAPNLGKDLFVSVSISRINSGKNGEKTILATFNSLFLGRVDSLLELLKESFPELGVEREDCDEVSWVQSALSFSGYNIGASPKVLESRSPLYRFYFKAKSDFVQQPVPENVLKGIWEFLYEDEADKALLIFTPYGGRMSEIIESAIPFPHREGNLYKIQHLVYWEEPGTNVSKRYISWIRRLYRNMGPFVSKFPRSAYVNYRDLDLGVNGAGNTSYEEAIVWGLKYFKGNFDRLVRVKNVVDSSNIFRNEQSIPPVKIEK